MEKERLHWMENSRNQFSYLSYLFEGSDLSKCHVLVIFGNPAGSLQAILQKTQTFRMLTLSHAPGFATRGVMINFTQEDGKLRFEVNQHAIERQKLKVSSQLLKLAKPVE